jgi:hypothetical protein
MFSMLRKLFERRTAVRSRRENPVLKTSVKRASEIWSTIPLGDFVDAAAQKALARQLVLDLNDVCNSRDPVMACRERMVLAMLDFARYQVLMIPPPPRDDSSGLRSKPGISGELQSHILELAEHSAELRTELAGGGQELTFDVATRGLQRAAWTKFWFVEAFNAARLALGDNRGAEDWYAPFMHAACANQEHLYRTELGLAPAFDGDAAQRVATAYSMYTDIVISGAEDPDREWRDYCEYSGVPLPA